MRPSVFHFMRAVARVAEEDSPSCLLRSRLYKFHRSRSLSCLRDGRNILSIPFRSNLYEMNGCPYAAVDLNAWPIALNPSERHRISLSEVPGGFPRLAPSRRAILSLRSTSGRVRASGQRETV